MEEFFRNSFTPSDTCAEASDSEGLFFSRRCEQEHIDFILLTNEKNKITGQDKFMVTAAMSLFVVILFIFMVPL